MVPREGILRYETNGREFDFPSFGAIPTLRFIIASTPRCGSNLLQRALWRSGLAGAPEEYLAAGYVADFARRFPGAFDLGDAAGKDLYVRLLWRIRTSPNGVFGLKLHGSHVAQAETAEGRLLATLEGSKWLWIRRHNRVAQAISYLRADQTGIWILDGEWLSDRPATGEPSYSREGIEARISQIDAEENAWASRLAGLPSSVVCEVYYEDLVDNYAATMSDVFSFLDVDVPNGVPQPGIRRQADEQSAQWERRFKSEIGG